MSELSKKMASAEKILRIYEGRPYPEGDDRALRDNVWRLAPIPWMNALWRPEGKGLPPERILVAGCGTGREAFQLSRRWPEAEIVAVDFSPRSIAMAKSYQRRAREGRNIRFQVADLLSRSLRETTGGGFDLASCHGVLSYIPGPGQALRNLAECLKADGALYLGVNGVRHFSENWREVLPDFGFDVAELRDVPRLRAVLRLGETIGGNDAQGVSKLPDGNLAGDLFGPLIQNLPLRDWVRMARGAGLSFQGSIDAYRAVRPALESGRELLMPRSRAALCELAEGLVPSGFHRLLFTKRAAVNPPWDDHEALLAWRPRWTGLFTVRLPKRSRRWERLRPLSMKSGVLNTRVDWKVPEWEIEILRRAKGEKTMRDIVKEIPFAIPRDLLRQQLYLLHQFMVVSLIE